MLLKDYDVDDKDRAKEVNKFLFLVKVSCHHPTTRLAFLFESYCSSRALILLG